MAYERGKACAHHTRQPVLFAQAPWNAVFELEKYWKGHPGSKIFRCRYDLSGRNYVALGSAEAFRSGGSGSCKWEARSYRAERMMAVREQPLAMGTGSPE